MKPGVRFIVLLDPLQLEVFCDSVILFTPLGALI